MKYGNNNPPDGEFRTRAIMILQHAIWYLNLRDDKEGTSLLRHTLMWFRTPSENTDWLDWYGQQW